MKLCPLRDDLSLSGHFLEEVILGFYRPDVSMSILESVVPVLRTLSKECRYVKHFTKPVLLETGRQMSAMQEH